MPTPDDSPARAQGPDRDEQAQSDSEESEDTDRCKHCGGPIDGEPLNQLTDVEFDDEAAEEDGYTQVTATYGDGPYCSFGCLNAPADSEVRTDGGSTRTGREVVEASAEAEARDRYYRQIDHRVESALRSAHIGTVYNPFADAPGAIEASPATFWDYFCAEVGKALPLSTYLAGADGQASGQTNLGTFADAPEVRTDGGTPEDDIEQDEWRTIRIGTHLIQIANRDGEPFVNIRDHASMAVAGEHRDVPTVLVERGEFPTNLRLVDDGTLWNRYADTSTDQSDDGNRYEEIDPSNGGWEAEVRSHTMDAVRACEFFGLPEKAAAKELERLAAGLREDGYDDVLDTYSADTDDASDDGRTE